MQIHHHQFYGLALLVLACIECALLIGLGKGVYLLEAGAVAVQQVYGALIV